MLCSSLPTGFNNELLKLQKAMQKRADEQAAEVELASRQQELEATLKDTSQLENCELALTELEFAVELIRSKNRLSLLSTIQLLEKLAESLSLGTF